jgi:hypothetical protein
MHSYEKRELKIQFTDHAALSIQNKHSQAQQFYCKTIPSYVVPLHVAVTVTITRRRLYTSIKKKAELSMREASLLSIVILIYIYIYI